MSDILPQSNFQATYGRCPIVANRVFECLECQQYVVFTSSLLESSAKVKTPSVDTSSSNFKTLNQSDLPQQPISYDFYSLPLSASDYLKPMQSLKSSSNVLDSSSFFPLGVSPVSFPQVTHPSYSPTIEASPRRDEAALLRLEIEQLKDIVHGLKDSKVAETEYIDSLREEISKTSTQLQKVICDGENLESRVRGVEDYLPSLVTWAEKTTHSIKGFQKQANMSRGQ